MTTTETLEFLGIIFGFLAVMGYSMFEVFYLIGTMWRTWSLAGPLSFRYRLEKEFQKRGWKDIDWKRGVMSFSSHSSGNRRVETYTFDFRNGTYTEYESRDNTPWVGVATNDGFYGFRVETTLQEGLKIWNYQKLSFRPWYILVNPIPIMFPPIW